MLKGLVIKQIQMRNQGKGMLKDTSLKNLLQSCDKPMVKCLLEKSIKGDDSPNNERGIFTPVEVVLAPCLHLPAASGPVQYPGGFTNTSHSSYLHFYFIFPLCIAERGDTEKSCCFILFLDLIRIL